MALSKYYASTNLSVIDICLLLHYGFVKVGRDETLIDIIFIQLDIIFGSWGLPLNIGCITIGTTKALFE